MVYSLHCAINTLQLVPGLIRSIKINASRSKACIDDGMLMTDQAYELVQSGVPFRDAYMKVKSSSDKGNLNKNLSRKKSSSGSAYNLELKKIQARLKKLSTD